MNIQKFKPKLSKSHLLLIAIFTVGLASSCKKTIDQVNIASSSKFTTKAAAKTYVNEKLTKYAKILASLARNEKFRNAVNEGVAKKFDGDYNILLKDIPALLTKKNLSLKSVISMSSGNIPGKRADDPIGPGEGPLPEEVDLAALEELLLQPIVVNTDTLYPQIYIPFFDSEEEVEYDPCLNEVSEGPIAEYPYPVVVPFDGDEAAIDTNDVFTGFTYNEEGLEVPCGNISECFAKMHVVWAVTLNERAMMPGTTSGLPSSGPNSPSPTGADLYMPSITIKQHKESWIKGGSEIQMKFGLSWFNGTNPSTLATKEFFLYTAGYSGPSEIDVAFLSRNEINQLKSIPINLTYAPLSSWAYSVNVPPSYTPQVDYYYYPTKGDYLYLIIYEYDNHFWENFTGNGSASESTYGLTDSQGNFLANLNFYSNEAPYLALSFKIIPRYTSENSFNSSNAYIDNDQIIFKSLHRN